MIPRRLSDHEHLVAAIRQLDVRPSTHAVWRLLPALRVIDCVLSLHRSYYLFVVPRRDSFEENYPEIRSVTDLRRTMSDCQSAYEFVCEALNYRDKERAVVLERVVGWLAAISGDGTPAAAQLANLEAWARTSVP